MSAPRLPSDIRKLLARQHTVDGTKLPAYRLLDILATANGDVPELIVRFNDLKEPAMRRAFHDMAALLRAMEKTWLGGVGSAPAAKGSMKRDAEAVKSAGRVKIFTDGASKGNPGAAGIGIVIANTNGEPLYEFNRPLGTATNNEAEYRAVIAALDKAAELDVREAQLFCDSELVVNQINGAWKIKKKELAELAGQATRLISRFERCGLVAIPREQNRRADALATAAAKHSANEDLK